MKTLLINPPVLNNKRLFLSPPLGLMYIASTIQLAGHEVEIADLYSFDDQVNYGEYDFVGITGMSFQHSSILNLAKEVKGIDRNIIVGVGGSHATVMTEILLANKNIDFVFRGEFEEQTQNFLLSAYDRDKWKYIKGMCLQNKNSIHLSPPTFVKDIDLTPFPAWSLVDIKKYSGGHHGFFFEREPVGNLLTSRGCPFSCTFCAAHSISGKKWRPHSVKRVISEIDCLIHIMGIKELHIEDDNFCLSITRAKKIMREIIKRNYDLKIGFPNGVRIDLLDNELLSLMRKAGVYYLTFGIETGSLRIQKLIKKNLDLEFVKHQLKKVKNHGFYTQGFFILGFPYETENDMKATIEYAKSLNLDSAFFGAFVPLPGSEDFNRLLSNGEINLENFNWDTLFSIKPFSSSHLSGDLIEKYVRSANWQFYLRPKTFFKNLKRIKSLKQLKILANRLRS